MDIPDLTTYSYEAGKRLLEKRQPKTLKESGQFLTPPAIARYMAIQLGKIPERATILEPAIGSGVLACAVIEELIANNCSTELWLVAYETDPGLCELCREVLAQACQKAEKSGIRIHWQVHQEDFILACLPDPQPSLFNNTHKRRELYDYIISNPPYFKLYKEDKRVKAVSGKVKGHTNIYTLFMALSAKMLTSTGRACFIVPRSFCSGVYFSEFRRDFLRDAAPLAVHLFQSRDDIFRSEEVLQENVIFTFGKASQPKSRQYLAGLVKISSSKDYNSLQNIQIKRDVTFEQFLSKRGKHLFFRLPAGVLDEQILDAVDQWEGSLEKFGLQVSTGPVVPFRARELLRDEIPPEAGSVPLLWMQNIKPYKAQWPLENFDKPQAISVEQKSLLVPNKNYVILRRFSAKEDRRRLIAAPFLANEYPYPKIGFENHLNIIYRGKDSLQEFDVLGLSAILNSALIDRYFRIVNGNTQVNAAELRVFPLPPLQVIQHIGRNVHDLVHLNAETVDSIVFSTLWKYHLLPEELPMIQETRIIMGKIEQAQEVLEALGLPSAQRNEISALTLLVLAQLSEDTPWQNAAEIGLRVHDILLDMKKRYGRAYAENTRETIRRQVLHQFEQAGIAIRNSDDPSLATNSPRTYYVLSELVLSALRAYGSPEWETEQTKFINQRGGLLEIYQKSREQNKVPIRVAEGTIYKLSPGKHNQLQAAVIGEFGPRFAPGARLLYLGDTARKILVLEKDKFLRLGVMIEDHGKLPVLVLYDENKNWVFMIEAVTSHGPVSPKCQFELEELFKSCAAARVYVSAFLDFATFKRFLNDIAWETEVWIAEMPSHLIHYNGDKFLGPNT